MIDESFHLTPLDVRRTEFPNALRGYDKVVVEQFRERVYEELERLTRLNQDLETKAKNFHEQLRAFRERDKALNEALVAAQQLRAEIREQAERESQLILREARAEGEKMLEQARGEIRRLQGDIETLERSRRAFLSQQRTIVERQLAELEAAAGGSAAAASPAPSAASPASESALREGAPRDDVEGRPGMPTPAWLDTLVKE